MITITKFTPQDAIEVAKIIQRNLKEVSSKDYPKETIDHLCKKFTPKYLIEESTRRTIFVAKKENKIVGTGGYYNTPAKNRNGHFVLSVFVLPEEHKKGIGSALMKAIEADAEKNNIYHLLVPSSIAAKNFYLKLGFTYTNQKGDLEANNTYLLEKNLHNKI